MGTIYKPKMGTQEIIKTIRISPTKSFKLTGHINDDMITFFIGGKDKYCIEIQIFPITSSFNKYYDITNGNLAQIYYDMGCSLEGGWEDTNIIIRLAISLIKREFPHVKTLTFKDTSEKECISEDSISGQFVQLSEMYFILNGKTWYEENFGAYLEEKFKKQFNEATTKFQNFKKEISWEDFKIFITVNLPFNEVNFKTIYNESDTWQNFFSIIKNKIGIGKFCVFISPWLHNFLDKFLNFNFMVVKYVLPIDNSKLKIINFTISDYKVGGNYTRRVYIKKRSLRL